MPFRYRFQKVLNVKSELRKRAEQDLGVVMAQQAEQQRVLDQLLDTEFQTREMISGTSQQPMAAHTLMTTQHYLDALKQQVIQQRRRVHQAELQVKKAREHLQKAMQIENMWEKDRERRSEQYKEELLRQEQKLMDEMAQNIRSRQQE